MTGENSGTQSGETTDRVALCSGCDEIHPLTDEGLCAFCSDKDHRVEEAIEERLRDLVRQHDLPTVFWSLDSVYDDYDERMQDFSRMPEEAQTDA